MLLDVPDALVLAPLDRVEIDAFLHELPERAQLAEESDTLLDSLEDVVNLHLCREPTNTESDAAVCTLVTVAQGSQNVAGLQRRRGTSTTRGERDILECHEQRLTLHISKGHVDATGVERVGIAILSSVLESEQAVQKAVRQILDALCVILESR